LGGFRASICGISEERAPWVTPNAVAAACGRQPGLSANICHHLAPLVRALTEAQIAMEPISSPYGEGSTWWRCDCLFKATALRVRLRLEPCVVYAEYDGHAAGADATWTCQEHNHVLLGPHPSWAAKGVPVVK
jgi:hypothetical protein